MRGIINRDGEILLALQIAVTIGIRQSTTMKIPITIEKIVATTIIAINSGVSFFPKTATIFLPISFIKPV